MPRGMANYHWMTLAGAASADGLGFVEHRRVVTEGEERRDIPSRNAGYAGLSNNDPDGTGINFGDSG